MNNLIRAEINFGTSDWRCLVGQSKDLTFKKVERLLRKLPPRISRLGIGGSPLRFHWWKKLILQLDGLGYDVDLVEPVCDLTTAKIKAVNHSDHQTLYVQIRHPSELKKLRHWGTRGMNLLVCLSDAIAHSGLLPKLDAAGIGYRLEQPTRKFSRLTSSESTHLAVSKPCAAYQGKIIGLDLGGNVFPCVSLAVDQFRLGNIFLDQWAKIMKNYRRWRLALRCEICCQARSWDCYQQLNRDPWCYRVAENNHETGI